MLKKKKEITNNFNSILSNSLGLLGQRILGVGFHTKNYILKIIKSDEIKTPSKTLPYLRLVFKGNILISKWSTNSMAFVLNRL